MTLYLCVSEPLWMASKDAWSVHRILYPPFVTPGEVGYRACKEVNSRWMHTLLKEANFTTLPCPSGSYPLYDGLSSFQCLITRIIRMQDYKDEIEEWESAIKYSGMLLDTPNPKLLIINWNNSEELPKCPNATTAKISTKKRMPLNTLSSTRVAPTATTATTT